jgi:leader peptidase (prepilin peptidase) / N-methyltransferase
MTPTEAVSTKSTTGKLPVSRSARIVRAFATPRMGRGMLFGLVAIASIAASLGAAPGTLGVLGAALGLLMMTIAVIDWRSFIIPDPLTITGLALGLVHAAAQEAALESDAMVRAVAIAALRGAALALAFLIIRNGYARIRGRQGLGLGDVKLAGVAGAWLGWSFMPMAI